MYYICSKVKTKELFSNKNLHIADGVGAINKIKISSTGLNY